MPKLNHAALAIAASITVAMPSLAWAEDNHTLTLTYEGRSIDTGPYFYAFPYRMERVSIEHGKLYFSRHVEGEGKRLFVTDWNPDTSVTLNSDRATKVTDIDLNAINFWGRQVNTKLNGLIAKADEDKAERINLWLFADGADAPTQLTDVDYVYDFVQSEDHSTVYYTARYGSSDNAKGCLEELVIQDDGGTQTRQLICDDNPTMPARINWWNGLRVDSERVLFPALEDGDRNKQEYYAYRLSDGSISLIFEGHGRAYLDVWNGWGDETQALFAADRDLYRYDFEAGERVLVKTFDKAISGAEIAGPGDTPNLLITNETPFETKLELISIGDSGSTTLSETSFTEDIWLADGHDGTVLMGRFSPDVFAAFDVLTVAPDGSFESKEAVAGLSDINDQLSHCNVDRVQIVHEDKSAQTPGTVQLDVFIYRPKNLPPIEEQKFVITAYYGGKNEFSFYHQQWCALGITTVSPAVRGDWRYGPEFANSNDRAGADAPVRDTLAVARDLMERFNIPSPRQIGTTGYSHGGWAAVRTLGYPGQEKMDLGFAIAGGGFYDLPSVVDPTNNTETNIHGWFDKEFGTADQQDLLRFLSPSNFIDNINSPIFLYHGARDTRVSPNQAQAFSSALTETGKPHELLIIEDQGHSIRGPHIWARINQDILNMITEAD
ncbi:MAG: prolyl oligopeptidase family serine peptidase [Pseudomonadota bacterium]